MRSTFIAGGGVQSEILDADAHVVIQRSMRSSTILIIIACRGVALALHADPSDTSNIKVESTLLTPDS